MEAIKQGGLTGQGMGEGILKDKVPEAHTDYIIAVISEEFGAIFVLLIVILFLFIGFPFFFNKMLREDKATLFLSRIVGHETTLVINFFLINFLIKCNC